MPCGLCYLTLENKSKEEGQNYSWEITLLCLILYKEVWECVVFRNASHVFPFSLYIWCCIVFPAFLFFVCFMCMSPSHLCKMNFVRENVLKFLLFHFFSPLPLLSFSPHTRAPSYICICVCNIFMYVHIYMFTHTHTHTHTGNQKSPPSGKG